MADLKVGIVLSAIDKATKPLRALSGAAGRTGKALAKMGDQDAASRKIDRLAASVNGSDRASWRLGRRLRELLGETRAAAAGTARLASWQVRLGRAAAQARSQVGRLGRALDARLSRQRPPPRAAGRGGFLGGVVGGVVGSAVFSAGRSAMRLPAGFIGTASQLETLEATLGTIEGSAGKARKSMDWINRFATQTPFQIDQVADAFVKLRAYGMDPTNGLLRTLGDTASAMGKDVMQAVEAIADAVTGENERLKEFGIKARTKGDTITYEYTAQGQTRTATADARDRAEIQRVLEGIMESRFGGAMADRMQTFSGMVSNLGDQWFRFQAMVMASGPFEVLKDRLRGVLDSINAMAESGKLQEYADRVGQWFTDAFATFESEVWPVLKDEVWPALKDIAGVIGDILKRVNDVVNAFGGWGVAVRGIALLLAGKLTIGVGRMIGRGYGGLQDAYGSIKKAVASERAKGMREGAGRLARPLLDAGKTGLGKAATAGRSGLGKLAGWLLRLGRFIVPLASVALKGLAVLAGAITGPIAAAAAAIAIAGFLIWKNWEPIKDFFKRLWEGVRKAFSAAWEWLSSIDWSGLGKKLLSTLAAGIRAAVGLPFKALEFALGKLRDLLPGSDARAGPLSRLTASGRAILPTMGEGVRRAGPAGLQRPLARALGTAAAGLALSAPAIEASRPAIPLAAPPAPAARDRASIVHNHYRIEIRQLPGEDAQDLAERILREIDARQALAGREIFGDAY